MFSDLVWGNEARSFAAIREYQRATRSTECDGHVLDTAAMASTWCSPVACVGLSHLSVGTDAILGRVRRACEFSCFRMKRWNTLDHY
jgi:hypothetical protein